MAEIIYRECTKPLFPHSSLLWFFQMASSPSAKDVLRHKQHLLLLWALVLDISETFLYIHSYTGVSSTQPMSGIRSRTEQNKQALTFLEPSPLCGLAWSFDAASAVVQVP